MIVRNDTEGKEHGAVNVHGTSKLRGSHKVLHLAIVLEPHRDGKGIRQMIPGTRQGIVRLEGFSEVSHISKVVMNHSALRVHCKNEKNDSVRSIVRPHGKARGRREKVIDTAVESQYPFVYASKEESEPLNSNQVIRRSKEYCI